MEKKQIILRLREDQIHSGMVVIMYLDGKEEPEKDSEVGELVFQALLNAGHPHNAKLYPLRGGIERHGKALLSHPLSGFRPNVRFKPINVYGPEDAPCKEHYVVFVDGEYLLYEGGKHPTDRVYIHKDEQGRFQNDGCCLRNGVIAYHEFEFPLLQGALLVSIDEVEKLRKQNLAPITS